MRLQDLEIIVTAPPAPGWGGRYWILVKLTTDTGIVGWGECYASSVGPKAMKAVIADVFARHMQGENPENIELMFRRVYSSGFTQRPDLYAAIDCGVPLLDMLRYHKLLAGASWVGEYGSPEVPEERATLTKISPYHNLEEGTDYPRILFYTSTRDDRVHPGHARKMAARSSGSPESWAMRAATFGPS